MRRILKSAVERSLCGTGAPALMRRRHAGETLVLAYHNIVPEGEPVAGDVSLHLAQRDFARQLDVLQRTHDVVPLASVLEPGTGRRPRAVITFDDAYEGALSAGVAELARRGLPATVFVAPAFVGGGTFWWDVLAAAAEAVPDLRTRALAEQQGRDSAVREWAASRGLHLDTVPSHQRCATEAQLHAAEASGITLGSHSWSHPNLATLTPDEVMRELADSWTWLVDRFTAVVRWLAYPYGLRTENVARAAAVAGFDGALRVDGGWLRRDDPASARFETPRRNIPAGLSLEGFELRISG